MTKKELMYQEIEKHGNNLINVFSLPADTDPVKLCKKLRRIEKKAENLAVMLCNGAIDSEEMDKLEKPLFTLLEKILAFSYRKIPVFINRDPRGYALKIKDNYVRENNLTIHRDWGGYGIIAPDFREFN